MLGSICNFFHLAKHSKFLQAIAELIHTVKNCTCKGNMGPKSSWMIILKISYNHKSLLIRTPGYLIRFPNYQNKNVPQTSCKSEGKRQKKTGRHAALPSFCLQLLYDELTAEQCCCSLRGL